MWDNKMINNDNINKKLDKLVILKRLKKKKNKKSKEEGKHTNLVLLYIV